MQDDTMAADEYSQEEVIDRHIGQRLRMRRLVLGLSQQALGEVVGVSFQQIQKYERGIDRVSSSKLYLLANHLGVEPSYFFEELSEDASSVPVQQPVFERSEADELVRLYNQIKDPSLRKLLVHMARKMRRL